MVLTGRKKLINVTGLYLKPFETKWVIFCEAHKCPGVFLRRHITLNELLVYMCHNIKHWRSALLSKIMWELLRNYTVPLFSELHYLKTCTHTALFHSSLYGVKVRIFMIRTGFFYISLTQKHNELEKYQALLWWIALFHIFSQSFDC